MSLRSDNRTLDGPWWVLPAPAAGPSHDRTFSGRFGASQPVLFAAIATVSSIVCR
jgi:hypothetical protein